MRSLLSEPPTGLRHEPEADLTAPQDLNLHFTSFKKWALVKLLEKMPVSLYSFNDINAPTFPRQSILSAIL